MQIKNTKINTEDATKENREIIHTSNMQPNSLYITGLYFDGKTSKSHPAQLYLSNQTIFLEYHNNNQSTHTSQHTSSDIFIEPALGNIRRVIKFTGKNQSGGRFESKEFAKIKELEHHLGKNQGINFIAWLESSWRWALGSLITVIAFSIFFFFFGLPALARLASKVTPNEFLVSLDQQAIDMLDNGYFMSKSTLSQERQKELRQKFQEVKKWTDKEWAKSGYNYNLLLRNGEPNKTDLYQGFPIGANAFALPNGTIVMTDQLIALAKNDRELMGVLAHEIGHVQHRHALTSIYQAAGIGVMIVAITGDLISTTTMVASIPTALLQSGYSRQAETESDVFSGKYMMETYQSTKPLRDLLARLETDDKKADEHDVTEDTGLAELMMSHPGTKKRIEHLRQLELNWHK